MSAVIAVVLSILLILLVASKNEESIVGAEAPGDIVVSEGFIKNWESAMMDKKRRSKNPCGSCSFYFLKPRSANEILWLLWWRRSSTS